MQEKVYCRGNGGNETRRNEIFLLNRSGCTKLRIIYVRIRIHRERSTGGNLSEEVFLIPESFRGDWSFPVANRGTKVERRPAVVKERNF